MHGDPDPNTRSLNTRTVPREESGAPRHGILLARLTHDPL